MAPIPNRYLCLAGIATALWCLGASHLSVYGTVAGQAELFPLKFQEGSDEQQQSAVLNGFSLRREEDEGLPSQSRYGTQNER